MKNDKIKQVRIVISYLFIYSPTKNQPNKQNKTINFLFFFSFGIPFNIINIFFLNNVDCF